MSSKSKKTVAEVADEVNNLDTKMQTLEGSRTKERWFPKLKHSVTLNPDLSLGQKVEQYAGMSNS